MAYRIGLDIGGSTTKVILMKDDDILYKNIVSEESKEKCLDTSIALLKEEYGIDTNSVSTINITGAGESFFGDEYKGFKLNHIQEFEATGAGALYLSKLKNSIVVSMGTGTAFYKVTEDSTEHIIGTGVGGGTINGLSQTLLGVSSAVEADSIALNGLPKNVDLTIGDISNGDMPGLPVDLTASNFGKRNLSDNKADIAAGMFNMVFQTIGTMTVLVMKQTGIKDVILTGQVSTLKNCMRVLSEFNRFYGTNISVPENSAYATVIGACIKGK